MADQAGEGQPEPQHTVKQVPPEVEIVVDAKSIPTQGSKLKEEEEVAGEVSDEQLKRELDEADGSSVPAKYAEAVLAVDDNKG